ncbi:flagellar export chaperone FliS [Geotalea uraniireducens]|uniref:Flagellar secretion chaperone FliS n=1 Tax=Geotalea uraniireducens (strain Rf4) TaxID=351605 RepID=A5G8W8_GEOUR|nr:flagellar export chaperone FliS [Geotalea uraniireducens]ABQ28236.1 flagellar protein FliS [Geotalea uraniireducens Rf4]
MANPYTQYQTMQVGSASPEKILIMLYEGAINFTRIAADRMRNNDIAGKGKYIGKALAIVTELMNTLNHDVGGEIAINLERLYMYLISEFTEANLNNSAASLENAINVLTILKDGWNDAILQARKERAAGQADTYLLAAG